jgi:Zn-finger nucleic acid-binding protein
MFLGAKFCPHCGAKAVRAETKDARNLGECPRCRIKLHRLQIAETILRECEKCDGLWADVETFENVCANRESQSAVLSFTGNKTFSNKPSAKVNYVPCPDCKQLMNRSNFARASGVIIDICKQHGVWFDAEELPNIVEFIRQGGLVRAREKEKIQLEEQRKSLREQQHTLALEKGRFDEEFDLGPSIREYVSFLFD